MILDLKYVMENGRKMLYAYMPKIGFSPEIEDGYIQISIKEYEWRKIDEYEYDPPFMKNNKIINYAAGTLEDEIINLQPKV